MMSDDILRDLTLYSLQLAVVLGLGALLPGLLRIRSPRFCLRYWYVLLALAFIVPFAFIYGPELLWIGSPLQTLISFATAAFGLVVLAIALEGYFEEAVSPPMRLLLGAAAIGLIMPAPELTIAGAVIAIGFLGPAYLRRAINR